MKIYDCFIFNHELEMLELRLNILQDVVDYFVITESDTTFSGKPKEKHFLNNKNNFKKWENKIIYNEIKIPQDLSIPWDREIFSRNQHVEKLKNIAAGDDLILTSDADEIPNPKVLRLIDKWYKNNTLFTFKMKMYYYYLNNLANDTWFGTRACSYSLFKNKTVDDMREGTEDINKISGPIIDNAGWHFSYCGDANHIKNKIESFCDRGYDNDHIKNNIFLNIQNNTDIFFRGNRYKTVNVDNTFPSYLTENLSKYKHLIRS